MKYVLSLANDDHEWDAFVGASPQGSIFSHSRYLSVLSAQYSRWQVKTPHGELLAGVAVIEQNGAMHSSPLPYTPYQGIMFSTIVAAQPNHKRVIAEFRLTEFLIQALIEHYGNFSMAFSTAFTDFRPFLWHNYHDADSPRFELRLRYTALLSLEKLRREEYLKSIRAVRRQEIKKARAEIGETDDVELFLQLYVRTFERQNSSVSAEHLKLAGALAKSALANKYGRLSIASTEGGVASIALFVYDQQRAYYLFGANAPELRNSGSSPALIVDNVVAMAELGLSSLDFVGVNSPNRGDFKLSFNPTLKPYYEVNLSA